MREITNRKLISRRRALSLLGLGALVVPAAVLTTTGAEAQTSGAYPQLQARCPRLQTRCPRLRGESASAAAGRAR